MFKSSQILILFITSILFSFCGQNNRAVPVTPVEDNNHKIVVVEVLQSNSYTYVFVKEGFKEYWIATSKFNANVNDELYYKDGIEMKNLDSKELERTFEEIVFVDRLSASPVNKVSQAHTPKKNKMSAQSNSDINVKPADNGISLADLFSNMKKYENQEVVVRGQVVKFNEAIMNKNWIHIQDGTEADGKFDLTITSLEKVSVDDIITMKGTILLNKDFGSGYTYEIIMEEAQIVD